jgi:nitroreductase
LRKSRKVPFHPAILKEIIMDIINCILNRRSIRQYTSQEVEHEKLILLLQAAMAAPTACNSQPWEFIVVTDQEILSQLQSILHSGNYNAPAAVAVCANLEIANNTAAKSFWEQDCSAATENLLLAAVGLGLGTVWIGVHPLPSVVHPVAKILKIPENVIPLNVVYVGYPAEAKNPRTQFNEHRVHWQQYQPRKRQAKIKNAKYLP